MIETAGEGFGANDYKERLVTPGPFRDHTRLLLNLRLHEYHAHLQLLGGPPAGPRDVLPHARGQGCREACVSFHRVPAREGGPIARTRASALTAAFIPDQELRGREGRPRSPPCAISLSLNGARAAADGTRPPSPWT